jgi:hypothetical protein
MRKLVILYLSICLITSCKKDSGDTVPKQEVHYLDYIIAGDTVQSRVLYSVINPIFLLPDSFGAKKMFDINKDSINDFMFGIDGEGIDIPDCPCDSGVICDCFPNPHVEKFIRTFDSIEIAVIKGYDNVKRFKFGDTINKSLTWKKLKYSGLLIYRSPYGNYGEWVDTTEGYSAFRIKNLIDTTYGWLRIDLKAGIRLIDYGTNRIKK